MSSLHESEPEDDNGELFICIRVYMSTDIHHRSVSAYNDGKGIQISASLVGILQPPKAGEKKRRTNAKPPVTTQVVYIHENTKLIDGLIRIIGQALNRRDLCKGGLDEHGGMEEETTALFSLEYTIPRTQLKDVQLRSEDDWKTFLEEASKKATAQGKLVIR
jgi:hypothetical protein